MKKIFFTAITLLSCVSVFSQTHTVELTSPYESCTSIGVGRLATTDGSVITSHTCDGTSRTWMEYIPAKTHADTAQHEIIWDIRHTESPRDRINTKYKGSIPEAKQTYAYLNTGYPCLNEKQLAMGESTFTGRRELRNENALFLIEDLQGIALERCATAREAIQLIGELVEKYGYADWGECITIADKNELWFLEITGEGKDKIGGLWAAQRIPDDHVAVTANYSRISTIDFNDTDKFMTCKNLREKAKKLGLWDGKRPFKFWEIVSNTKRNDGKPFKPFTVRDYFILNTFAPSAGLSMEMDELPLSVKPDRKIALEDVTRMFRETYEGTEWDMTRDILVHKKLKDKDGTERDTTYKSPIAHNWMTNEYLDFVNALRSEKIEKQRTVAVVWCAYSTVIQCRNWLPDAIGGVCWWAEDNPGESPRVPLFAGQSEVPESYKVCGHFGYRPDAALWTYRRTNRLAEVNWGVGRKLIEPAVLAFEKKAKEEMPLVEQKVIQLIQDGKTEEAQQYINRYSTDFIYATLRKWEEMEGILWHKFGRGF